MSKKIHQDIAKEVNRDFRDNLGPLMKGTDKSLYSIENIRNCAKKLDNSMISHLLPCRQTISKSAKKAYD